MPNFGVSGTAIEESKETVVGRRDIFRVPGELQTSKNELRKANSGVRTKTKGSMLAKLTTEGGGTPLDFNLTGTHLGGSTTTAASSQNQTYSGKSSFNKRPHSLNARAPLGAIPETSVGDLGVTGNSTGMNRTRLMRDMTEYQQSLPDIADR